MDEPLGWADAAPTRASFDALIAVMALQPRWAVAGRTEILSTLLDTLLEALRLDFVQLRPRDDGSALPVAVCRLGALLAERMSPPAIVEALDRSLGTTALHWPSPAFLSNEHGRFTVTSAGLGPDGEFGRVVAGSRRIDFPTPSERRVLDAAAKQAAVWLRQARPAAADMPVDGASEQRPGIDACASVGEDLERSPVPETEGILVELIPAMVWRGVVPGDLNYLNQRAVKYLGHSAVDLSGSGWLDLVHPADRDAVARRWQQAVTAASAYEDVYRILSAGGQYRWIRSIGELSSAGRVPQWYGVLIDIDDQHRAEDALRESENHWRSVIDAIPALVCTFDVDGRFQHMNRRGLEYLGRDLDELRDWQALGIVHADDLAPALSRWSRSIATGQPYEGEHRLRRADGEFRWFHVRGLPLRDTEDRIIRWFALLLDVQDAKAADEDLRRSEALLAQAQRVTRTGSLWWKVATGEIVWSDESYRLLEYPRHVVPTVDLILSRVHPEDLPLVRETVTRSATQGANMDFEHRVVMPDGAVKHLRVVVQKVETESGGPEFAGAITDITERKRAEAELRQTQAKLTRASQIATIAELSASIAHEMNQPLAAVVTHAQACQAWLMKSPPVVERALVAVERIVRDGHAAADVVARLRALFRHASPSKDRLDIREVVLEVLKLNSAELRNDSIVVDADLGEQMPSVPADRVQIQQVMVNLVRNAIESMADVRGRRKLLSIRSRCEDGQMVVEVSDEGCGLPDPDAMFDAFYTTKASGMGMGLAICRSIVEAHGGRLWASSNEGVGSTFGFSLPLAA